jgi:hypothetical protein
MSRLANECRAWGRFCRERAGRRRLARELVVASHPGGQVAKQIARVAQHQGNRIDRYGYRLSQPGNARGGGYEGGRSF